MDKKYSTKRRPVNLTIREDVLSAAKAFNLNASKAAESGIMQAVKDAKEKQWLEDNQEAIKAHNKRVENEGTLLRPKWDED